MMKSKTFVDKSNPLRVCRYVLEGTIEMPKRCLLNHECHHCGYDQWLDETGKAALPLPDIYVADVEALAA